jgi:4-amino-4-deoxy-L-arabinose transferase-like glycosyltransferase
MSSRRAAVALVLALAFLPALPALPSRSFFSPDETNYAQVAREMLETGDLVVPHLDGQPWFNKPPLAYWLLAGAFALLGWGFPTAVLLNTALTAATALVLLGHAGGRERPRAGALAAVAFLTMALPLTAARTALTDPALVLCTTLAVTQLVARRRGSTPVAGVALGLGTLAKGPVAPLVVLPAAVVAAWQDGRAGWRRLGTLGAAAAAVVVPWQAALAVRGVWPAWAAEFVGHETVARATEAWSISAPWWYYLPVLWAALFPWGTHAAVAVAACLRGSPAPCRTRPRLPEMAAVAVPLVAFSLATNKLPHYVLPALPFVAAWLGRAADRLWEQDHVAAPRWAAALVAGSGGGALAATAWLAGHSRLAPFLPPATAPALAAAAAGFVGLAALEGSGRRRAAWGGMAALALLLRLGLDGVVVPQLDRLSPERPLAESVRAHLAPGGQPIAHRWWRTGLVAYGVRGWRRTDSRDALEAALAETWAAGRRAIVVVRADSEGEGRAAVWRAGGEAAELDRRAGPGEINGEVVDGIVLDARPLRSGTRWFYDADAALAGEHGLSGAESNPWTPSFRWTTAAAARLPVAAAITAPARLRVRCWGIDVGGAPQRLAVTLGGRLLGTAPLATLPAVLELAVPAGTLGTGAGELVLAVDRLAVPARSGLANRDERTLGVAIDWIALDPDPACAAAVR